jgi:predicted Zn-dependent peptidase
MNRLVTTSPTDEELSKAKRFLLGIKAIQLQSRNAVAEELASLWGYGLPPDEIGTYDKKIGRISAADVDTAAQKYFPADRMTVVAVGEEKVIRDSLAPFGLPIQPAP